MKTVLMEGNALAEKMKGQIKKQVSDMSLSSGIEPHLAAVQVGENPASRVYVKNQASACEEIGIRYSLNSLPAGAGEKEVADFICALNVDSKVTGIILQMPLPQGVNARNLQALIDPFKDVEGVNPSNMGMLVQGRPRVAPCTSMAVMALMQEYGIQIKGKEAVIVGHSEIVGKPVALFLLSSMMESATTTVCHIATSDLSFHTRRAEILIVAAGKAGLIKGEMIRPGAVVIDVGINRVPVLDASGAPVLNEKGKPKKKTVGDVVFDEARTVAGYITPVPGGVGPLTVVMLMKNTMEACSWQIEKRQVGG